MTAIRFANADDWERIIEIYNQAVDTRISTADLEYASLESKRDWLRNHSNDRFPIYVAEVDFKVVGWCSLSPYREGRPAVAKTAEISYYVSKERRGQRIGTGLVQHALSECPRLGLESLVAILLEPNVASINLLLTFGFEEWGRLPQIAEIDGIRYDHLYLGLSLSENVQ